MTAIVEADNLGKRYGDRWGLKGCTLSLPAGRAIALVGPNGAGKTTLLQLMVGLLRPTEGAVRVCGHVPFKHSADVLPRVAFVAQDQPLYTNFTAEDLMTLGAHLNRRWDDRLVRDRLRQLRVPLNRPVGRLSGGQRAQVALGLSLAKQADLVVLDEPLASLDPLARQEFLQTLMEAVTESGATLVLSSHIVDELERVCDYMVILATARVQLTIAIDEALDTHKKVTGPPSDLRALSSTHDVVVVSQTPRQMTAVVKGSGKTLDPSWETQAMSLQEIVLAYLTRSRREEAEPAAELAVR